MLLSDRLLDSSMAADKIGIVAVLSHLFAPYQKWIFTAICTCRPDTNVVDCFPNCGLSAMKPGYPKLVRLRILKNSPRSSIERFSANGHSFSTERSRALRPSVRKTLRPAPRT